MVVDKHKIELVTGILRSAKEPEKVFGLLRIKPEEIEAGRAKLEQDSEKVEPNVTF